MIRAEGTCVDVFRWVRVEGLIILWYTEFVRWMVCWKQSIEKTMKFAITYITDVAHFHRAVTV